MKSKKDAQSSKMKKEEVKEDEDIDPLDAFMMTIDKEVKKTQKNKSAAKPAAGIDNKGLIKY